MVTRSLFSIALRVLKAFLLVFCALCVIAGMYYGGRVFLADGFIASTESMEPTLYPGDKMIVNKMRMGARLYSVFHFSKDGQELKAWRTRGTRGVQVNDVVVFNFPYHNGKLDFVINHVYAKRCVALPGDSLGIVEGFYQNNNYSGAVGHVPAQQRLSAIPDSSLPEWILRIPPYDEVHFGSTLRNMKPRYIPRKGDLIRITPHEGELYKRLLEWELGKTVTVDWARGEVWADNKILTKHTFLHNYYFMAGDNVLNSSDSRYWGLVPEEYIVGVVTHRIPARDGTTGRFPWMRLCKRLT